MSGKPQANHWIKTYYKSKQLNIPFCIWTQGTFAFALIKYSPLKYNNVYIYPWWGNGVGWILALTSMLCIPLWAAGKLYYTPGTLREVRSSKTVLWRSKCPPLFHCVNILQRFMLKTVFLFIHCSWKACFLLFFPNPSSLNRKPNPVRSRVGVGLLPLQGICSVKNC